MMRFCGARCCCLLHKFSLINSIHENFIILSFLFICFSYLFGSSPLGNYLDDLLPENSL